jgi:hypothetical protein
MKKLKIKHSSNFLNKYVLSIRDGISALISADQRSGANSLFMKVACINTESSKRASFIFAVRKDLTKKMLENYLNSHYPQCERLLVPKSSSSEKES